MAMMNTDDLPPGIRNPRLFAQAREDKEAGLTWYESMKKRKAPRSTMRQYYIKLGYVPV